MLSLNLKNTKLSYVLEAVKILTRTKTKMITDGEKEAKPLPTINTHMKTMRDTKHNSSIPIFFLGANLKIQWNNLSFSLSILGGFRETGGVVCIGKQNAAF